MKMKVVSPTKNNDNAIYFEFRIHRETHADLWFNQRYNIHFITIYNLLLNRCWGTLASSSSSRTSSSSSRTSSSLGQMRFKD